MADPVRRSAPTHVGQTHQPESAHLEKPPKAPARKEDHAGHSVTAYPKARGLPAIVAADDQVRGAEKMKEAIALANELLPAIQGRYEIESIRVKIQFDEQGRAWPIKIPSATTLDLSGGPTRSISKLGPPEKPSTERYGATPRLSVDAFGIDLEQAKKRTVEDTAKTIIHEWAHTALNRLITQTPNPSVAYDVVAEPVGLYESIKFKSPVTGEFVEVTPSGPGVSEHEMVAQYVEQLVDRALAERKKKVDR